VKGRRPRPLDDGDSGEVRVSGHLSWAKLIKNKRSFLAFSSATIIYMSIISNCTATALTDAATTLLHGNLVAFPTETVYGLGVDASNKDAVARVYAVKGRPADHPLIVHISSATHLDKWASEIPEYAIKLTRAFWPGPMTLILPRTELAKDFITGGQNNVGLRVPEHSVALALLKEFEKQGGLGIAAPSANRFGKVSPTTASAVSDELSDYLSKDDLILDGGPCAVGVESTIIDCTKDMPTILRPGAVTKEMIEDTLGISIDLFSFTTASNQVKASGLLESHYAPKAKVFLTGTPTAGDGLVALASYATPAGVVRLAEPRTNEEYAKNLYEAFRLADHKGIQRVFVIPPEGSGIAIAINDRLAKSANTKSDSI
jgi:L-threonylcarbamoyladenylate synthase